MTEQGDYLEALGGGPALTAKVEAAVRGFVFLCGSEPERIFVCNTIDPTTDEQGYAGIWGFHGEFWMEARGVGSELDVDISSYVDGIHYLGIQYKEIQLPDGISERSRLSVEIQTDKLAYSSLSAVGLNCGYLLNIIDTLFRPNLSLQPGKSGVSGGVVAVTVITDEDHPVARAIEAVPDLLEALEVIAALSGDSTFSTLVGINEAARAGIAKARDPEGA